MKTVKEVVTLFKEMAAKYDTDLQFNIHFEDGTMVFGESWDFIKKYNFYGFLHSKHFEELNYSYDGGNSRFKVIRIDKDELEIKPVA
ncbi:hypothetical protein [Enterococcus xiangfangensis]|uniref:hypothetical protein n=1 Tax=Enterococcus xiangfangensis TaxID=1296537 RepID=UPI003D176F4C|nr:hypothetical protein [Enterococcus asini]